MKLFITDDIAMLHSIIDYIIGNNNNDVIIKILTNSNYSWRNDINFALLIKETNLALRVDKPSKHKD